MSVIQNILILNPPILRLFILKGRFNLKTVWLLSLLMAVFLLAFYIFQVNEITKASFSISNHEKQIEKLSQESKNLEINFSSLSSLKSLEELVISLNYEEVGKIHYIQMLENTVVAK